MEKSASRRRGARKPRAKAERAGDRAPAPRRPGDVANRLLFENGRVKVWEMDLAPGESSDFHEHTLPYVLRVVEGDTVDADFDNGKSIRIPVKPGQVYFVEPGSRETAVNRSSTRFREFLIELKA